MQRLRPGIVGLALALVLAVAGCGDGDGDDGGAGETPGEPTLPPPATTEPPPTPSPTPTPTPESTPQPDTYEVQQGDTLWDIAERFGVGVDAIVEANDIDDPSRIFPGDELVIPAGD